MATKTRIGIQILGALIGAGLILLIAYLLGWLGAPSGGVKRQPDRKGQSECISNRRNSNQCCDALYSDQ